MNVKRARFMQMKAKAARSGKVVPTLQTLEELFAALIDMACPVCQRRMNWLMKEGGSTCITLQHDRSGAVRLICFACNVRHRSEGDAFYDRGQDEKICPRCKQVKNLATDFYKQKDYCKPCKNELTVGYARKNRT